jgi:hypothetical protein
MCNHDHLFWFFPLNFQYVVVEPPPEVNDECSRENKQSKHSKAVGTYFRDGRRKIDYVLVHEEVSLAPSRSRSHNTPHQSSTPLPFRQEGKSPQGGMLPMLLTSAVQHSTPKQNRKMDIRKTFLDKLKSQGIEIEEV